MTFSRRFRLPVSTRHAFALAFDLAVRRDPVQSLLIPLLLRAPWILALAVLPSPGGAEQRPEVLGLRLTAVAGDLLLLLVIGAMLRIRARSVFNTAAVARPAPALECYAVGLRRVPWLLVTEMVRNLALVVASFFLVLPGLFLGFRLAFATEAVVLSDKTLPGAIAHSFRLSEGRFERWLEMVVLSAVLGLSVFFFGGILLVAGYGTALAGAAALITWLLITASTPIIQYAWTFFYLRLIEAEAPGVEVGPAYAGTDNGAPEPESARPTLALVRADDTPAGPEEPGPDPYA